MEVKDFIGKLFVPNLIMVEPPHGDTVTAINYNGILENKNWVQKNLTSVPVLTNQMVISICFDADINNDETFDESKEIVYTVVANQNDSFFNDKEEKTFIRSIINVFEGNIIPLPKELMLADDLIDRQWSYRIVNNKMIFLTVVNGSLYFDWC